MKVDEVQVVEKSEFWLFSHAVKKNCGEFVHAMAQMSNSQPLYRGMITDKQFGPRSIRSDRKPRDASNLLTSLYNFYFEQKFRIPNIRNNCVFCTGEIGGAQNYGFPSVLIPEDGSRFFYEVGVHDSYSVIQTLHNALLNYVRQNMDAIKAVCAENDIDIHLWASNPKVINYVFSGMYESNPDVVDPKEVSNFSELEREIHEGLEVMLYDEGGVYYYVEVLVLGEMFPKPVSPTSFTQKYHDWLNALEEGYNL